MRFWQRLKKMDLDGSISFPEIIILMSKKCWCLAISPTCTFILCNYHVVILSFNIRIRQIELTNSDPPYKIPHHFGAKNNRADSTLEMVPPLYFLIWFLDLDQTILCTDVLCKDVPKCK